MVSKVAVIAIVAILAVPILLGYAMNVEQVTETDYRTTGDPVNVTPLLQQGVGYTETYADIADLNMNTLSIDRMNGVYPYYINKTFARSPLFLMNFRNAVALPNTDYYLTQYYNYFETYLTYPDINNQYVVMSIYYVDDGGTHLHRTVTKPIFYSYTDDDKTFQYIGLNAGVAYRETFTHNNILLRFTMYGGYSPNDNGWSQGYGKEIDVSSISGFVDFAAGFRVPAHPNYSNSSFTGQTHFLTPLNFAPSTLSYIITIDLSSITDPNYKFAIGDLMLEKTTTDGNVKWAVKDVPWYSNPDPIYQELYYDQTTSNNTYQLKYWVDPNDSYPHPSLPGYNVYKGHREFRYVGAWPTLIGEANYFQSYDFENEYTGTNPRITNVQIGGLADTSPIMRIDQAKYRAMEYSLMQDQIYKPGDFKTNPSTKIDSPILYGSSIEFGGNTYLVKKGNITMGNHDIPVKGLVLSSVPNPNGGYDNKIGNTVISTTAGPSTIKFNGSWSASITTSAQEEYEVTKTEWKAGDFAWDGMDHNFIMAGLLASLGAFVGVGIYARRTKSSVWPLLIVCGGAALLFFVML